MKVAVGSTNPVKIQAVKEAFEKVWPDKKWEFLPSDVKSGVPDQPMSFEESIKGATNRAKRAMKLHNADFGVGLEGGIHQFGTEWFDAGWLVVVDQDGTKGVGSTINMHVPPKMMKLIKKGVELGMVNDIVFKEKNTKQGSGHFGHMTNDIITRKDGYRDGVITALARFIRKDVYE